MTEEKKNQIKIRSRRDEREKRIEMETEHSSKGIDIVCILYTIDIVEYNTGGKFKKEKYTWNWIYIYWSARASKQANDNKFNGVAVALTYIVNAKS